MVNNFEQFSAVISGIYRYTHKIERNEMVKRGYKGAFAQYLATLRRYEEGLTSTELCEVCDKDKAAVSRIIAEMEEKGLVQRPKKAVRGYRSKITLTEEGKKTADYFYERSRLAVQSLSDSSITDEQKEIFYLTLNTIYEQIRKVSEEGIPVIEE